MKAASTFTMGKTIARGKSRQMIAASGWEPRFVDEASSANSTWALHHAIIASPEAIEHDRNEGFITHQSKKWEYKAAKQMATNTTRSPNVHLTWKTRDTTDKESCKQQQGNKNDNNEQAKQSNAGTTDSNGNKDDEFNNGDNDDELPIAIRGGGGEQEG